MPDLSAGIHDFLCFDYLEERFSPLDRIPVHVTVWVIMYQNLRWSTETVRELIMDAIAWTSRDDIYSSFFEAVGAPAWHGRNLNALWDSVRGGQINEIEAPYRLVFKNYAALSPSLKNDAELFIGVIREAAEDGVPVDIRIDS